MSSVQVVHNRINEYHRNTGTLPTSLVLDVVDFIRFADDLFSSYKTTSQVSLPSLENVNFMMVEILAENQGVVLRKQEDILRHYAQRAGLFSSTAGFTAVADVQIGPWRYPVVPPTFTGSPLPQWWNGNYNLGDPESWNKKISADYQSGIALQNGIEFVKKTCSCDMVTLMNYGCKCNGV